MNSRAGSGTGSAPSNRTVPAMPVSGPPARRFSTISANVTSPSPETQMSASPATARAPSTGATLIPTPPATSSVRSPRAARTSRSKSRAPS